MKKKKIIYIYEVVAVSEDGEVMRYGHESEEGSRDRAIEVAKREMSLDPDKTNYGITSSGIKEVYE